MRFPKNGLLILFACTAFLGAGLLFLSELMVAKLLLPLFGGSPAVWNICMVFFQAVLLLGYVYAHASVKKLNLKYQSLLHGLILLLPLLVLPLVLPAWAGAGAEALPIWNIVATLTVAIGAPFFVLSTAGPLLQSWFAATSKATQPYFLYAAGNLGSFIALLSYPFIIEPVLSLKQQTWLWAVGYGIFAVMVLACIVVLWRSRETRVEAKVETPKVPSISWRRRFRWMFLAALPSSLMLGVTTYVTTDVAATPLLWMVPLALYLLTFVLAFGAKQPLKMVEKVAPVTAALLVGTLVLLLLPGLPQTFGAVYYIALFALVALIAHSRLAANRPNPVRLTEFYLWLAIGGVLGGSFNSLIAPVLFNDVYEFPLVLLAAVLLLVTTVTVRKPTRREMLFILTPALLAAVLFVASWLLSAWVDELDTALVLGGVLAVSFVLFRRRPVLFAVGMAPVLAIPIFLLARQPTILTERTFYGVIKIGESSGTRIMSHGFTKHGSQSIKGDKTQEPTTYYHREGPLGDVFAACRKTLDCKQVGSVGMGVGTVAAYGRQRDKITFYEIDPAVVDIAKNPRYFTFTSDSRASVSTVIGDGRLSLAKTTDKYDLLIIDAFSSDSIPTHLLTREALDLYKSKLSDNGILAIHISNRNLNIEPVLKAAAHSLGMQALVKHDRGNLPGDSTHFPADWAVMATSALPLQTLNSQSGWGPLQGKDIRLWTDDYSNLLDAL